MSDDDKRRRYLESGDTRALRGFAARDTRRLDVPTPTEPVEDRVADLISAFTDAAQAAAFGRVHNRAAVAEHTANTAAMNVATHAERIKVLERDVKRARALVGVMLAVIVGGFGGGVAAIRSYGQNELRLDQVEAQVKKITDLLWAPVVHAPENKP